MYRYRKSFILVFALAIVGIVSYAADNIENDALNIAQAKISLVQAVNTAERHINGKASRAEFKQSKKGWVYNVEAVAGAKVFNIKVDAGNGTILTATEDTADRDDGHDGED